MLWYPPIMVGDDETTLIIAGDLWDDRKFLRRKYTNSESWMKRISTRFKYVVFVLGNHDYWGANLTIEPGAIRKELEAQGIVNVHLLEIDSIVLDNIKFLGGTMWTDYDRENPHTMVMAPMVMANDHTRIKIGENYSKLRVEHLLNKFNKTKKFIFENAKKDNPEQRVICVTHMAPSYKSIHEMFQTSKTNGFYYSDLEVELCYEEHDIEMWIHGHTHMPMDYVLHEKTRIICNPRGYYGYERTGFNEELRFEL